VAGKSIKFSFKFNGVRANLARIEKTKGAVRVVIEIPPNGTPEDAAAEYNGQPDVIILLFGTFAATLAIQVRSVFARALVPIAHLTNALIVDNGINEGMAEQMGFAAQQAEKAPMLLGIVAANAVSDPNHNDVMKLPAEWAEQSKGSFLIVAALARGKVEGEKPVVGLLVGGGEDDKLLALRLARKGWPLLIMQGAQGLGDHLVSATTPANDGTLPPLPEDPDLQEIVDTATISSFPLNGNTDDLKSALLGPIQKPGEVLADAWNRYDNLDRGAIEKQRLFRWTQSSILSLTVLVTLLAIVAQISKNPMVIKLWWIGNFDLQSANKPLHVVMIIVPIVITMLAGFNARFREGNKWILLRAAAEAIKREIFRYRTRSGVYSDVQCKQAPPSIRLAANIKNITANLVQSEVNRSSLPRSEEGKEGFWSRIFKAKKEPDQNTPGTNSSQSGKEFDERSKRVKFLKSDDYLKDRVENQIGYFVSKTRSLYRELKTLQVLILIAGGVGTFLAAMSGEVWVALTTALAAAVTNKLEIEQVENSLVQYNMALSNLRNVETWWKGLSPWERTRQKNIDLLVDQTETTLEHETTGWVQQMQSTLDRLTEKENGDQNGDSKQK
jgi:hypothetical protein